MNKNNKKEGKRKSPTAPEAPETESFGRVAAVVVCYNTGSRIHATIKPLFSQTGHVFLVDNGSELETREILQSVAGQQKEHLTLITRADNNLAAGQNAGIREALKQGYDWVLLLDHDSIADDGMLAALQTAFASYAHKASLGILAPRIVDANARRAIAYARHYRKIIPWRDRFGPRKILDNVIDVMASGSLIPARVFNQIGFMDESFGIDYVDKDFCLRAVKIGYRIVAVREALLTHRLGECKDHVVWRFRFTTANHPPARRYSIYRNRINCWIRHGVDVPAFLFYDIAACLWDLLRMLAFEDKRLEKLSAIGRGVKDAVVLAFKND